MSEDPTGPRFETLRSLSQALPAYAKQQAEKKFPTGKGFKVKVPKPRQVCRVCDRGFDFGELKKYEIVLPGECEDCDPILKQGYTALKCGGFYAFVKGPQFSDVAGEVLSISEHVMAKVRQQYQLEWKTSDDKKSPPPTNPATN